MTGNQIVSILLPTVLTVLVMWLVIRALRARKSPPPAKTHGPHTPVAGYDPKAMAQSKGNGMGDSGLG